MAAGDYYRYGPGGMPYGDIYTPPGILEPLPGSPAARQRARRSQPAPRQRSRQRPQTPPRSSGGGIVGGAVPRAAAPPPAPRSVTPPAPSFTTPPAALPATTPAVAAGRAQPAFVLPHTELGNFVRTHYAPAMQRQVFQRLLQREVDPSTLIGVQRRGIRFGRGLAVTPGMGGPDHPRGGVQRHTPTADIMWDPNWFEKLARSGQAIIEE